MPMDGIMLGCIVRELGEALTGGRVDKITQPEKDELLFTVRNKGINQMLLISAAAGNARMHITSEKKNNPLEPPVFCMLMRKFLLGSIISDIRQCEGDRIAEIDFDTLTELGDKTTRTLVAEFMGKYSNIILVHENGKIADSVIHVTDDISRVREVLPGLKYERPPQHGKLDYTKLDKYELAMKLREAQLPLNRAIQQTISGVSAQTANELAIRCGSDDPDIAAERICELIANLDKLKKPLLVTDADGKITDATPFMYLSHADDECTEYPTLSALQEEYYRRRDKRERINQKAASIHRVLKTNIERCEKKLGLQMEALKNSERVEEYRIKGELLSANLYLIKRGMKSIAVANYYDPDMKELDIELDVKLSPAANAQRYFKLYQKAKNAGRLAQEQIDTTSEELYYLEGQLENLSKCTEEAELFELRTELEQQGYMKKLTSRKEIKSLAPSMPLKLQASNGTVILVGKNNLQNDKLTFSAMPNEVWLHVKDMPGSHVIIVGEDPDEKTIGEAASLAAYYSKGRESTRVAVDYTLRKYVKKPSGAKPGFVIYTHQHTIYAEPRETIARI